MTPSATPSPPGASSGESDPKLRYISKYLAQVISDATPKSSTSAAKRVSGARVLTSAKCAAILEEREQKKKEIEDKNKRKAEREQKRKEKEDAAKKKAEERAKKAEEAAKKRENRAKKRTMPVPDANIQAKKRKTVSDPAVAGTSATADPSSSGSSDTGTSIKSRNSSRLSAAAARSDTFDTTINSDVCCVCYRTFEDDQLEGNGLEWVQCVCGRWLHEECICDIDIDDQGRELFCPFCAV